MSKINPEKYIDLALKYKTQVTIILSIILMTLVFFAGRATVDCPPKEVVCKSEITTIKKLFEEIEVCQSSCKDKLREQRDLSELECLKRIRSAIDNHRSTTDIVSCEEAKAIMPQCKRRGKW
tara:strand:+ start:187 stop:552 length:366 start_codon:yes stop_codon:yes gene_type:complete